MDDLISQLNNPDVLAFIRQQQLLQEQLSGIQQTTNEGSLLEEETPSLSQCSEQLESNEKEFDEETFVEEIRKFLCLWDTKSRAYKDGVKKNAAWKALSLQFGKEVDYLKKTWKNLKDNFSKCLKRREKLLRSGAAAQTLPKCKLFDQLVFLRDTVANRPTVSNIASAEDSQEVDLFTPPGTPPSEVAKSNEEYVCNSTPQSNSRKRKASASAESQRQALKQEVNPVDQALLEALKDDDSAKNQILSDPDVAFVHSIIPILKSLPPKQNRFAKVDIQNLLIRYEFGDD